MNLGHEIEDIIENLCKKSFFADFTVRSPKYRKSSGQQKEAADIIVIFNGTLLAIQIKSKTVDSSASQPCRTELNRVSKTVDKAIKQFRALSEALRDPHFKSFINGRGMEIPFDKEQITDVILIVVFVPIWEGDKAGTAEARFDMTCYSDGQIPIHLFTLRQFSVLLLLLDTLPDFLFYLEARWALHGEKLIAADGNPLDEWALITFEKDRFIRVIEKKIFADIAGLHGKHGTSIHRLERKEKSSYFVDRLIEELYAIIGLTMPVDPKFNLLAAPNSTQAYQSVIPHLAKLNRNERSQLVEFLLNRAMKCQMQEIAFRGFKFNEKSEDAYLVLAARFDREERRIALSNISMGMGYRLQAKRVIGIAVGHEWPESTACDVAVVDVSKMEPSADLIKMTEISFSKAVKSFPRDS